MKSEPKKRSTKAIKLLLVSSAFILQGCRPKKEDLPIPSLTPEQKLAQSELTEEQKEALREANGGQLPVVQTMPQAQAQPNHFGSHSSWGYNPFYWGYGSSYGRSNNWSSSSSYRSSNSNSGFFSSSGSGPASHFGAQSSSQSSPNHSTTPNSSASHTSTAHSSSSTVHSPTTHTSSSHVASSPSVSHGGFGGHASASS